MQYTERLTYMFVFYGFDSMRINRNPCNERSVFMTGGVSSDRHSYLTG